ncbi:hypothetical protein V6N13_053722 [Hibiscus sabdariffa]
MVTIALIYRILHFLRFSIYISELCALTALFFTLNTTLVAYFFGKEIWNTGVELVTAILFSICPGYIPGMLLAMQIRFVGFQQVQSGEHIFAMGVFFLVAVELEFTSKIINVTNKSSHIRRYCSKDCSSGQGSDGQTKTHTPEKDSLATLTVNRVRKTTIGIEDETKLPTTATH